MQPTNIIRSSKSTPNIMQEAITGVPNSTQSGAKISKHSKKDDIHHVTQLGVELPPIEPSRHDIPINYVSEAGHLRISGYASNCLPLGFWEFKIDVTMLDLYIGRFQGWSYSTKITFDLIQGEGKISFSSMERQRAKELGAIMISEDLEMSDPQCLVVHLKVRLIKEGDMEVIEHAVIAEDGCHGQLVAGTLHHSEVESSLRMFGS